MEFFAFFKRQLLIAHVFGIPVRIDYRWFPVLILVSWMTAQSIPQGNIFFNLALGFVATLIFFATIFLHELAHAVTARLERVEVTEIVLHPFGGLARLKREPDNPRTEFRIAIAGPAASFLISLFFLILTSISNNVGTDLLTPIFFMLFFWNILLAVFNLFPGYPLDGGRVLRAYLWKRGKDLNEATILTGRAGQIIALALIVFGLFRTFVQGDITGLWIVLVGLFLYDAANGIIKQINQTEKITVEEVMLPPFAVEPETTVQHFVAHILPLHRQTVFPVAKNKQFYGMLALEDLRNLPRSEWKSKKALEAMRPIAAEYFVEADLLLSEAQDLMKENGIGALGVVDAAGNLIGFLQQGKLRRFD
jgi:Zn-dependent protease/CBS domain-containing protein